MNTPFLDMSLLAASQSQKHVTLNDALVRLDALIQLVASAAPLSEPPSTLVENARYLVGAGATGAFSGHSGSIAIRGN